MKRGAVSSGSTSWVFFGIPVAAILCCGLPIFLTVLGFTAIGAFLTANRYFIFGGMVVLMGIAVYAGRKKRTQKQKLE